jgi:hypothetical protein
VSGCFFAVGLLRLACACRPCRFCVTLSTVLPPLASHFPNSAQILAILVEPHTQSHIAVRYFSEDWAAWGKKLNAALVKNHEGKVGPACH